MNVEEFYNKSEYSKIDFGSNPTLFSKKELLDFAKEYHKEQLCLNGVSRSVWVVQNKTSKVAHCIFTTQEEAIDCIDGLSNFEVKEFSLVNNVDL